jgi:hypothetical protein
MALKEAPRSAVVAWSPLGPHLGAATAAGAVGGGASVEVCDDWVVCVGEGGF